MNDIKEDFTDQIITFIIAGYTSARTELIERIKARDLSIRLYLTAVSIIFSVYSIANVQNLPSILRFEVVFVIIGVVSVAMSQSVANNQIKIATIGYFIDKELIPHLSNVKSKINPIDWESCVTNKETSRLPRKMHHIYYYLIFLFPQFAAILVSMVTNFNANQNQSSNYHVIFLIVYILCFAATAIILYTANSEREKLNIKRNHQ